jgi:hypothetical protein
MEIEFAMFSDEEQLLRILGEATERIFPSEITDRLNRKLGTRTPYTITEIVMFLKRLTEQVVQTADGRWTLKRRITGSEMQLRVLGFWLASGLGCRGRR